MYPITPDLFTSYDVPFPSPGDIPNSGVKSASLVSNLIGRWVLFSTSTIWEAPLSTHPIIPDVFTSYCVSQFTIAVC